MNEAALGEEIFVPNDLGEGAWKALVARLRARGLRLAFVRSKRQGCNWGAVWRVEGVE